MCNPNSLPDHKPPSPAPAPAPAQQCHLYLDLISAVPALKRQETTATKKAAAVAGLPMVLAETKALLNLALPIALTALILYSRSMLSMLFLGHLGDIELAAGSLAIAFANITGYSVLSGLSLGMEPLCAQAFGAQRPKLLSLTLQRSVIFLLVCSAPIASLWLNISTIFQYLHQDPCITKLAGTYLAFSLPDLVANSFIHPIRIYLRAQGITHPLTLASLVGAAFHLPINYLLVSRLGLGVAGVAAASAASNLVVLVALVVYIWARALHAPTWTKPSLKCLTGWAPMVRLAAPSCVSVCLEWWWYEIMIVLCGLLVDPKATVASMGVLIQTTSLLYVLPSSLSLAVSTRVGNELGASRPDRARVAAIVSIFLAGMMGLSAMTFATSMRNLWARMYTDDVDILRLTSAALPILGLCELGNCPQTVGCGVVRGTARLATAANVNLGAFYLVGMPVAVGLGFWLGVGFRGLWIGLLSAQVCCAGLMLYVVGTTNWEYQAVRAQLLTCGGCGEAPLPREDGGDENDAHSLISLKLTSLSLC
ncbi:protein DETOXIFICATION 52-like [Andrographis paniculata]|uniref:protein DETOXIFICATION 52-like n=1 Tax=Andrographis paniculata TaxID=175694 RepID=UPI0021E7232C|nr:protein DETOXIFICATION 52-like [Andrographis paniculata]